MRNAGVQGCLCPICVRLAREKSPKSEETDTEQHQRQLRRKNIYVRRLTAMYTPRVTIVQVIKYRYPPLLNSPSRNSKHGYSPWQVRHSQEHRNDNAGNCSSDNPRPYIP